MIYFLKKYDLKLVKIVKNGAYLYDKALTPEKKYC